MKGAPIVSVIIPVYNRIQYLSDAIDSVLSQTYQDTEIIVVDDGSTVDVAECLQRYAGKIIFLSQPHTGPSAARNFGARSARGKYLAFLDDDDLFEVEKFKNQKSILDAEPAAGLCYSGCYYFSADSPKELVVPRPHSFPAALFSDVYFQSIDLALPATMLRKSAFMDAGMFNETLRYNEDAELWLRMSMLYPVVYSPYPSASVRNHHERASYRNPLMIKGLIEVLEGILERFPDLKSRLGGQAVRKIASLHYLLGWTYIYACDTEKAQESFDAYRNSGVSSHSRLWLMTIRSMVNLLGPRVVSGGYAGLVSLKRKFDGS